MSSIQCKAMVCREVNKPFVLEDITVAPPQANEVRIKILYSSCCHTDKLVQAGIDPETVVSEEDGVILGHEAVGIVESIGEGVTNVAVGDTVLPAYVPQCDKCRFCASPKTNLCQAIRVPQGKGVMPNGTSRYTDAKGRSLRHFMGISAFSQYVVCADISVVKITTPKEQLDNVIKLLPPVGCGWTTGYGTVINSGITAGESIAIIGLGGVGLAAIYGAKQMGAKQIIAIDINPKKFDIAKKLGATHFINPKELGDKTLPAAVMELTEGGWGVDYSVEAVGNVNLMNDGLKMCVKGWGTAIIIGVACGVQVSTPSFMLVSGRTWTGKAFGNVKSKSQLPGIIDDIAQGKIDISDFITGTRPMAEINEAFDDMSDPNSTSIRTIIDMWQ